MIGSFWNLCRACPSMPVDKLHSEYRSTYRWHEYTGSRPEVVRHPPQSNNTVPAGGDEKFNNHNSTRVNEEDTHNEMPKLEPALPRRKKHPELAYRHHEFLASNKDISNDANESTSNDRARSEERGGSHWRPSRRSKSEGPVRNVVAIAHDDNNQRRESDSDIDNTGRETGLLRKAISKISTEYRLQFAWPQGHVSRRDKVDSVIPRKSLSMGAIKPTANSMVHKKRTDLENKDATELEPLVSEHSVNEDHREDKVAITRTFKTEYKKNYRPFSQYEYSKGRFTERPTENKITDNIHSNNIIDHNNDSWYCEVVELRKKAGQYKHRGWGTELAPERLSEFYNKQIELWDQVSRRSSLSALSLASTTHSRPFTKEEKEQENNKRSSPTKNLKITDNSIKAVKDMIRHHLDRTTGGSELDGLILSPTREKLEPTIPRKDDEFRGSQLGSPQKYSPQKGSPQKSASLKRNSQKVKNNLKSLRSQSVGPTDTYNDKRSPKRQSRTATAKEKEKRALSNSTSATRKPRPSSLNTTASFRSKCSTIPLKIEDDRLSKAKSNKTQSVNKANIRNTEKESQKGGQKAEKIEQNEIVEAPTVTEPEDYIDLKPVVKSPPEPTRVKSPEQILMRSPDPVNWTVPLDTGKTFTVTQNIREGDLGTRAHSEVKAWTPPEVPPPVAQSAPPQLSEQVKEHSMSMS